MDDAVTRWFNWMEGRLKQWKAQDDREKLREVLDELRRHTDAWDTLYRPPIEPERPLIVAPVAPSPGLSLRTMGSNG